MGMIFDVITVVVVGFTSVIAFNTFWRGGNGFESRLLVALLALLGFAGFLQVVKAPVRVTIQSINPPPSSSAAAPIPTQASPPPVAPLPTKGATPAAVPIKPFFELFPAEKYDSNTDAMIDGVPRPNSRGMQFCSGSTQTREYAIDGKYATFHALLGLTGTPNHDTVVKFEVLADNKAASVIDVKTGQGVLIDVPLTGVQRLTLVATSTAKQADCKNLTAQWADVQVVPH